MYRKNKIKIVSLNLYYVIYVCVHVDLACQTVGAITFETRVN